MPENDSKARRGTSAAAPAKRKEKTTASKRTVAASAGGSAKRAAPSGTRSPVEVLHRGAAHDAGQGTRPNPRKAAPPRGRSAGKAAENPAARRARSGDLFMESRTTPPAKSRDHSTAFGVLNVFLLAGIGLIVVLMLRQNALHADFVMMRAVVDQQTYYDGTTVDGIDVSNMTYAAALDHWRDAVEPGYYGRTVTLDNGTTVTSRDLGYTSDYEAVLASAWSAGRSGSLEERYHRAANRQKNPVAYSVTRSDYSENIVAQYVQLVAQRVDRPVQNAVIESFDPDTQAFTFTQAEPGTVLDQEALREDIKAAIRAGGGEVALPVSAVLPAATTEEVAARYGMISSAVTNASSSSRARLNNIKLAMSFINGTCVRPGETFSFNGTVGKRTTERGFSVATAYSSGEVTEQVGGGICQVSTTLFNAVAKADLEIVERHNHSLTVGYVDKGKDATVNWGSQDFRFKNTSADNVYICCNLSDDKRVRFGIFGLMLENGETITIEAATTRTLDYKTEYKPTPLLPPGQSYLMQTGRVGYEAEAYKLRWDAEGNQIGRELLCKSRYPARNEVIQYGVEPDAE